MPVRLGTKAPRWRVAERQAWLASERLPRSAHEARLGRPKQCAYSTVDRDGALIT